MLRIRYTAKMKKDLKRVKKQQNMGYNEKEFKEVVFKLANRIPLEKKNKDHALDGEYKGSRECHLAFDLVLIYEIHDDESELLLMRIGSHDEVL